MRSKERVKTHHVSEGKKIFSFAFIIKMKMTAIYLLPIIFYVSTQFVSQKKELYVSSFFLIYFVFHNISMYIYSPSDSYT